MGLENTEMFNDIVKSIRDAVEEGSITNDIIADAFSLLGTELDETKSSVIGLDFAVEGIQSEIAEPSIETIDLYWLERTSKPEDLEKFVDQTESPYLQVASDAGFAQKLNCMGVAQVFKQTDSTYYVTLFTTFVLPASGFFSLNQQSTTLQSDGKLHIYYCVISESSLAGVSRSRWTDVLAGKVDKVSGKGLSTNDFTDEHVEKLNSMPTAQTGSGGSNKQYIYSDGVSTSNFCALSARETKIFQEGGQLRFRKNSWGNEGSNHWTSAIPTATAAADGAMSKADKAKLDALSSSSSSGIETVTWDSGKNANSYTTAGTYRIKGERTNSADGLPIGNAASGHTIDGLLYVFDSSLTSGTGASDDCVVTQLLTLSNRVGGQEGGTWMRSGFGASKGSLTWKPWGKMQTNVEVGVVNDSTQLMASAGAQTPNTALGMNNLVDNGIYSGVYVPNNGIDVGADAETFVMVVINNYAVAKDYKTITQVKLANAVDGSFSMKKRERAVGSGSWSAWSSVGGGSGSGDSSGSSVITGYNFGTFNVLEAFLTAAQQMVSYGVGAVICGYGYVPNVWSESVVYSRVMARVVNEFFVEFEVDCSNSSNGFVWKVGCQLYGEPKVAECTLNWGGLRYVLDAAYDTDNSKENIITRIKTFCERFPSYRLMTIKGSCLGDFYSMKMECQIVHPSNGVGLNFYLDMLEGSSGMILTRRVYRRYIDSLEWIEEYL